MGKGTQQLCCWGGKCDTERDTERLGEEARAVTQALYATQEPALGLEMTGSLGKEFK